MDLFTRDKKRRWELKVEDDDQDTETVAHKKLKDYFEILDDTMSVVVVASLNWPHLAQ